MTSSNTYLYKLYESAVQSKITYDAHTHDHGNALTDTTYAYNWAGHLISADVDDASPTDIVYTGNIAGEIVARAHRTEAIRCAAAIRCNP